MWPFSQRSELQWEVLRPPFTLCDLEKFYLLISFFTTDKLNNSDTHHYDFLNLVQTIRVNVVTLDVCKRDTKHWSIHFIISSFSIPSSFYSLWSSFLDPHFSLFDSFLLPLVCLLLIFVVIFCFCLCFQWEIEFCALPVASEKTLSLDTVAPADKKKDDWRLLWNFSSI